MRRVNVLVGLLAVALPAWASQPGQPLDCSDWVIDEPGYSCSVSLPSPHCNENGDICNAQQIDSVLIDNESRLLVLAYILLPNKCGVNELGMHRTEVQTLDLVSDTRSVLASVEDRCTASGNLDWSILGLLKFDPMSGKLLLNASSRCTGAGCYPSASQILAIDGFPKLFDIFQTYAPAAGGFAFTVPVHPEGLPSADHFDTYWGNVAALPDFTKAQPMACSYPASPPAVGDLLTVADTSPDPPLGTAYYIVTAVTHGTDRRYGRQLTGPTMTGRDPGRLPACGLP